MKWIIMMVFQLLGLTLVSQSVLGEWKIYDDNGTESKSTILLYKKSDGKMYGKINAVNDASKVNDLCSECKGSKKNQPMLGLHIIENMTDDDGVYSGGTILDTRDGKEYKCSIWVEDGELQVRGYWGFFYKTVVWKK